jgi:thiamine-phosphate pyrophosphorylase
VRDDVRVGAELAFSALVRAPLPLLAQARQIRLPVVAIGGIDADNGGTLLQAGADLLAVLGAVFDAPDPPAAARAFLPLFATN